MIATKVDLQPKNLDNVFSHKIYWLNKLSGELATSKFETDYLKPLDIVSKQGTVKFELPIALSRKIIKFTKKSDFSIYIILLACWKILLQKYTGNNELVVGSPGYRPFELPDQKQAGEIIPLRSTVDRDLTFKSFLLELRQTLIEAYIHQDCDFDEISHLLNLKEKQDLASIFDTVFLLENIHFQPEISQSNYALAVSCLVNGDKISATVKYSEELFRQESINSIIKAYLNVVDSVINNINIKPSEINFINRKEQKQLLNEFNDNSQKYPTVETIERLFEIQVQQTPNRIAVVNQESCLTYKELNNQANQLAKLLKNIGVKSGEFVSILKDRDINFLIGILAIWKVGGVYVPIDSTYPQSRIQYMLSNSEAKFLLIDSNSLESFNELLSDCPHLQSIICLDIRSEYQTSNERDNLKIYDQRDFEGLAPENLAANHTGIAPAYMLYTSGSTGSPKGAIVRHDGAINHIYAQFDALNLNQEFTFLQSAPSSTDISVWQFIGPLLIGGKTVIVDIETVAFAEKLFNALKLEKVTVVELVPTLFGGLLEYSSGLPQRERELPDLKWMILSGESTSIKWIDQWLSIYPDIKIANAYGPTEAADDITQYIIDRPLAENQRTVPIGKPLANLNLYILDNKMQLVPIGVPGEICVSGIGVGDGYWKNESKTKQAFVTNPLTSKLLFPQTHDVIYKTGDLGRWLADGNIEFLGRIDHQVKIRGFRLELGEIETFLGQHPNVRDNVVVLYKEETGNVHLVAYVVCRTKAATDISELRNFLTGKLPDHMIPSAYVRLECLPVAPSGKVDRKALPIPVWDETIIRNSYIAPRTPTEEILANIWQEILNLEQVGVNDNFFELGGHSLLATQVVSKIRQIIGIELPLRCLFESPTIGELAKEVSRAHTGTEIPSIKPVTREGNLPLSFAQQRLWFLTQLEPESLAYNGSIILELEGVLNIMALSDSINEIVKRHEVLRTSFAVVNGQPTQQIASELNIDLALVDLSEFSPDERETEIKRLEQVHTQQVFDLTQSPLFRLGFLRKSTNKHLLSITMHHIIFDAWSTGVFVRELSQLYTAFANNQINPLPELPIQYADFATWQRQLLEGEFLESQLAYWQGQLSQLPVLNLPTSCPREKVTTNSSAQETFIIPADLSRAIHLLSRQAGVSLFMTMLAVLQVLLQRYTSQDDIVVGTDVANRNRLEIEPLIGFFINLLVLRTDLSGNPSFTELLQRIRQVTLGAYAHQDLPFDRLVKELQPQRYLSYTPPLFQVLLVLQNTPQRAFELSGLNLKLLEVENTTTRFDLALLLTETERGIEGKWQYNADLFSPTTITNLSSHFQNLLHSITETPDARLNSLKMLSEQEIESHKQHKKTKKASKLTKFQAIQPQIQ
jgi:amino acid adenylation domain-containing protein